MKQIPLLHKSSVIELSIAQYCDEVRVRLGQCKDFETKRQFLLTFIDHVVYYKNLVELHGYVPVRLEARNTSEENESAKIEYKIITEIEWAERFANYRKKSGGSLISMMDFNHLVGESKQKMSDVKLFTREKLSAPKNQNAQ